MQGPATPEKFEHAIRAKNMKQDQSSMLKVCAVILGLCHTNIKTFSTECYYNKYREMAQRLVAGT